MFWLKAMLLLYPDMHRMILPIAGATLALLFLNCIMYCRSIFVWLNSCTKMPVLGIYLLRFEDCSNSMI